MRSNLAAAIRRKLKAAIWHLPTSLSGSLQGTVDLLQADKYECSLCGYQGRFWPFGDPPRRGAQCGNCDSVERHRLLALWLDENVDLIRGAQILHFAPELSVGNLLRRQSRVYMSADLNPCAADRVLNIENVDLPDASVDVVVCSHVLEYVDDVKALREIYRILSPSGLALLMFPIVEGWERTYENPAFTSASDQFRYFGLAGHVRMYGRDVRDRITDAGFGLAEFTAEEPNVARYGLLRGEKIFVAKKGK